MAVDWTPVFENLKEELKKISERNGKCDMERLTENYLGCNQIKGCSNGTCEEICKEVLDCGVCPISKAIDKLAEYEQAEEDGLLPRFHLGDEFWCLYIDQVVKAKIVSLQQKKDGSWNYTLSREISCSYHDIAYYKESEYRKYFWSTKAEAEEALAKMKGE